MKGASVEDAVDRADQGSTVGGHGRKREERHPRQTFAQLGCRQSPLAGDDAREVSASGSCAAVEELLEREEVIGRFVHASVCALGRGPNHTAVVDGRDRVVGCLCGATSPSARQVIEPRYADASAGTEEATMANPMRAPVIWRRYVADAGTVERGEALRSSIARGEEHGETAEEIRAAHELVLEGISAVGGGERTRPAMEKATSTAAPTGDAFLLGALETAA